MICHQTGGRRCGKTHWQKILVVLNPAIRIMTAKQLKALAPTGHRPRGSPEDDWVRKRFFRRADDGPTWTVIEMEKETP